MPGTAAGAPMASTPLIGITPWLRFQTSIAVSVTGAPSSPVRTEPVTAVTRQQDEREADRRGAAMSDGEVARHAAQDSASRRWRPSVAAAPAGIVACATLTTSRDRPAASPSQPPPAGATDDTCAAPSRETSARAG